jgi:hypothetical protein
MRVQDEEDFRELETRLRIVLPETYQDRYEDVQPVSMGSAGLKYGNDGKVAWNEIWGSFCDLAMAGGPPHKGALLEPGMASEIDAQPAAYHEAVEEIRRGIALVTGFAAAASSSPGWVRMDCESHGMAGWLARAITMENISVRCDGAALDLPAGPAYRVAKEVKNVITSVAKTCHYWLEHMGPEQHRNIANLFARMNVASPLIQPAAPGDQARDPAAVRGAIAAAVRNATGLQASDHAYYGWLGFDCGAVRPAVWMMRALVVSGVLARREGNVLFVPVNAALDPEGTIVAQALARIHRFAVARNSFA